MSIPFMIVIVFLVVVGAGGFVIFGAQCHGCDCKWG
jgi:lipopolysaccharide/colanic/teichoic acid biosynthesis glycosyltransferase